MSECRTCGSKTDAFICRPCCGEIRQALTEMPRDLADLQAVATRQAIGPLGLGDPARQWDGPFEDGALGDAAWEFAPGAADQVWAAANTLSTWARHIAESRDVPGPIAEVGRREEKTRLIIERNRAVRLMRWRVFTPHREQPVRLIIDWLTDNVEAIRFDEAAAQIHEEIVGLQEENQRWIIGRGGNEVFAGNCDATQVGFELDEDGMLAPVAAYCGVALYGREGEQYVRCTACGTKYPLQPRLDEIRERQINDQLARAHVIADALTTLEEPLGRELLRKWIQRDALRDPAPQGPACETCRHSVCQTIRRPPILSKGIDEEGRPLYRFGDVRQRLQTVQEQRGARLSA